MAVTGIRNLKISFLGVSHWHVPLFLRGVRQHDLNVISVSDPDLSVAQKFADELGCRAFTCTNDLLEYQRPDFVYAFARHCDMPALATLLIRENIPFSIEKPVGLNSAEVREVYRLSQSIPTYCAMPLTWKYTDIYRALTQKIEPDDVFHMSYRFIAGPTSRYKNTSPWLMNRKAAGGGCMTNLGVHFIDLALSLSGSQSAEVNSAVFHRLNEYDVEDYAVTLMTLESGASCEIETGYAYPMDESSKRDNRWNIATERGYYTLGQGHLEVREYGKPTETITFNTDPESHYAEFVHTSLCEYVEGKEPTVGLKQMMSARVVLDDAIRQAGV